MAYKKGKWIITCKNDVLCQLRRIAHSETLQESEKAIAALKDSEIWKANINFQYTSASTGLQ